MENVLTNGFCEMTQDEVMIVEGGDIWTDIVDGVTNFLKNQLTWTPAKINYNYFYTPIVPNGEEVITI